MRLSISAAIVLLLLPLGALAQEIPNFSGAWVLAWPKPEIRHGKVQRPSLLKVMQDGRVLKATFIEHGKTRTCTYYLDGAESKNVAAGGAPSSDAASIEFKTLFIKSVVQVPKATLNMEQKWQLSADSRHLIIQITASASSATVAGFSLGSWENVYTHQPQAPPKRIGVR